MLSIQNDASIKSLVICVTQLAGGLLLKMLKYFEVKHFLIFPREGNCRILLFFQKGTHLVKDKKNSTKRLSPSNLRWYYKKYCKVHSLRLCANYF